MNRCSNFKKTYNTKFFQCINGNREPHQSMISKWNCEIKGFESRVQFEIENK